MGGKRQIMNKIKSMFLVSFGGVGAFTAFNIYNENEKFYDQILMPAVQKLDPETSHNLAILACKYRIFPKTKFKDDLCLKTQVFGMDLTSPLGMAAGLDKQGEAVQGLHDVGFSFVEVGSVTPQPQSGHEQPRLFRLSRHEALINRMGFNSDGHTVVHERLTALRTTSAGSKLSIGVNLGKNKDSTDAFEDYKKGVLMFSDVADYLVVNVSSPNTAGLRDLQEEKQLRQLLSGLIQVRNSLAEGQRRPLLLKLSPDLSPEQRKSIAAVVLEPACRVDGLVVSNTTVARPADVNIDEVGGLSGRPLFSPSTALISDMYRLTKGQLPIIGVGGVSSGQEAYLKILAGASLVQLYSAFAFHGPPVTARVKRELQEHLRLNGWSSVAEAVGKGSYRA